MPPYLLHLISVYVLIILSEHERTLEDDENLVESEHTQISFYKNSVNLIACVLNIVNLGIFFAQTYFLGFTQLRRSWAYLDAV